MPTKGLNMRTEDYLTWATAESLAYRHGFSISRLVAALLYQYCCELGEQPKLRVGASRLARTGAGVLVPVEVPRDAPAALPPPDPSPVRSDEKARTMTVQGLAEASGQRKEKIQRLVSSGRIPSYYSGGTLLIDAQDVVEYLERCKTKQAVEWAQVDLGTD